MTTTLPLWVPQNSYIEFHEFSCLSIYFSRYTLLKRSCLFLHSKVVDIPLKPSKALPDFDRLHLNSLCNAVRIHAKYRIFARNLSVLYRQNPERSQLVVSIHKSNVSSTSNIHYVFCSDNPWFNDSFEISLKSQIVAGLQNATVLVDTCSNPLDIY